MLKIGLTGGIGSGKTTVASYFAKKNVPIIDADIIAHNLVAPGKPALNEIINHFGGDIVGKNGCLDRKKLSAIVFEDSEQKKQLERIVHPLVFNQIITEIAKLTTPYCIISIPLLFESKHHDFVDRILVVDCPLELQIARVKQRDSLEEKQICRIIETQVSREQKLNKADDIIVNDGDYCKIVQQVEKLHNLYRNYSAYSM